MASDRCGDRPTVVRFRDWGSVIALLTFLVLAQGMPVQGRAGAPDETLGGDGRVEVSRFDPGDDIAMGKHGRIVVAGSSQGRFAVARFRPDGKLDRTFSGDGLVRLPNASPACVGGRSAYVHVRSDGGIVAIGQVGAIVRDGQSAVCGRREATVVYLPDGSRDPSFGDDGVVIGPAAVCGVADQAGGVLPDGRIIAAGFGCDGDLVISRQLPDGSPDPAFGGGDGRAEVTALEGIWPERMDLAVQPDGKVVIATAAVADPVQGEGVPMTRFAAIRVGLDGMPDPSFGDGDGIVATSFKNGRCTASGQASAVAITKNGRIVVGGWASCRDPGVALPRPRLAFARYLTNGEYDDAFAEGGRARILLPIEKGMDYAYRLALQPDGRIVAVGTNGKALIVRVRPNGQLDRSFGQRGMLEAWRNGWVSAVTIDHSGRIVVAGGRWAAPPIIARYLAD